MTIDEVLSEVQFTHPPKPPIIANPVPGLLLWAFGSDNSITAAGPGFSHPAELSEEADK